MLIRSNLSPLVGEFNCAQWLQSCLRGAQPSAALPQRSGRRSMRIKVHESELFFFFFFLLTNAFHCGTIAPDSESMRSSNSRSLFSGARSQKSTSFWPGAQRRSSSTATRGAHREKRQGADNKGLIVSLSPGSPVHCPAVSVSPGPGPPRRQPAAAKSESSSSQHPESSHLPFFTLSYLI